MSSEAMEIYWYLVPTDGPYPWNPKGARVTDFSYFKQMAGAVDHCGYSGALLATGGVAHDAWITGAALVPVTERMKFIIAVHPGIVAPMMLAQKSVTFDQFSKGRLILNVITGEKHQFPQYGLELDHDLARMIHALGLLQNGAGVPHRSERPVHDHHERHQGGHQVAGLRWAAYRIFHRR